MKKITRKQKYITIGTLLSGVVVTSITVPLVLSTTNKGINLFDRTFSNREQLVEYALKNAQYIKNNNGDVYWQIDDGTGKKTFASHDELRKYIYKKIELVNMKHFTEIENKNLSSIDGSILNRIIAQMQISTASGKKRYYRGIDNTIHQTKEGAIDSYFNYHKIFLYNGITFRSSEELKRYLFKNYDKLDTFESNEQKFNISAPNGMSSNFFNFDNKQDREEAGKFIKLTSNKLIGFKNSDGTYNYVDTKEILDKKPSNNFWNNLDLNAINAVKLKSNDGNALWITDTKRSDNANFFGDYFTKSKTNEIDGIDDTGNWDKTSDKLDEPQMKKTLNAAKVGSFFNIINRLVAYSDANIKNNDEFKKLNEIQTIFDVPRYKKILNDLCAKYNSGNIGEIVNKLNSTSKTLYQGKRFNPLFEIPLLYLQTLAKAQEFNLKNKELKVLREFFEKVINDYQESLETILPSEVLFDSEGNKINLKKIFGINDVSFDLNSTPETAIYKLSESSKFMEGVNAYLGVIENKINSGGAATFYMKGIQNEKLQKMWVVFSGKANQFKNTVDRKKHLEEDLGRKLTDKQTKLLFNIMTVNDFLLKSKEKFINDYEFKVINDFVKQTKLQLPEIHDLLTANPEFAHTKVGDKQDDLEKIRKIYNEHDFNLKKDDLNTIETKIKHREMRDRFIKKYNEKIENSKIIPKNFKASFKNDIINSNSLQADQRRMKNFKRSKNISRGISGVQGVMNAVGQMTNLTNQIMNDDVYGALKTVSSIFNDISGFLGAFPVAGAAFQVAGFILDVTAEILGKKTQEIYKFSTSEDRPNKFYWDGGVKNTRFWGLWETEEEGIGDMKIAKPIKIWKGSNRDGYYYNGKFYKDENKLRKQALLDYAMGDESALLLDESNPEILKKFNYGKVVSGSTLNASRTFDTVKEMVDAIMPNSNKEASKSKIVKNVEFSMINGKVAQLKNASSTDKLDVKKYNISEFLKQIKPTVVVQLPEIINNLPFDQNQNINEAIKIRNKYHIPGKKVYKKMRVINSVNYDPSKYIMINLNEQINLGKGKIFKYSNQDNALSKMKELFLNTMNVNSIYALKNNALIVDKFDDLKTIKEYSLFKVMGNGGEIKFFKEYLDAFKWLTSMEEYNLKTFITKKDVQSISFNGISFKDATALIEYLDKLIAKERRG